SAYRAPLGQVPVDQQACQALRKDGLFRSIAEAHRQEHSVEIQLPFLQRLLRQFKLVPVLVGQCQMSDYEAMARALLQIVDEQTLLVASSDFTHYGAGYGYVPFHDDVERRLTELADGAIRPILACDLMGFDRHVRQTGDTICGQNAIRLLLRVLQLLGGADGVLMGRDMSGRMTGSFDQSVTYVAVALMATQQKRAAPTMPATTRPAGRFSPQERRTLLRLARQAVTVFLREGRRIDPRSGAFELTPKLLQPGAAFVTLRRDGRLRGCIGETVARRPLVDSVVDNAINAATRDRRFIDQPVRLDELPAIRFEVSVLSPLQRVASAEQIVLGRDGVVLERAGRRALFLPQVADETGWSKELFLSRLAMKAGLPPGAWRQPGTVFYTFTAEVFAEAGQQAPAEPVER
ncbi:MAG: AmmeMemoRadiSam system protein A, partial [Phycisphaerae bacterium]